jgi:hypothetical protein
MKRAIVIAVTGGLLALMPFTPASAAAPRTFVLTCDNGHTYATVQRPGTPVFSDTQSRAVLVIQAANNTDFTRVPDMLRTTCTFMDDESTVVGEFLITPAG